MTDPHPDSTAMDTTTLALASKPKRHRLFDFTAAYWRSTKPEAPPVASPSSSFADISPAQPDKPQSSSGPEAQIDYTSDLDSHSSSSESEQSEDETNDSETFEKTDDHKQHARHEKHLEPTAVQSAQRIQFQCQNTFYILYSAALPDLSTLSSLATRGTWAVIMAGGGHFCATLWDINGHLIKHKTFHRYTSRRKQGGSQSAADAARGNANRIRSAGATLRRYGEQALESEVHSLLKDWQSDFKAAQCIFIRAGLREKRDLLYGWEGSPLKEPYDENRVRNIPMPTRRATLKEATRVFVELSTVTVSPISLLKFEAEKNSHKPSSNGSTKAESKPSSSSAEKEAKPEEKKEKGTAHLKKREEKQKPIKQVAEQEPSESVIKPIQYPEPLDLEIQRILDLVTRGDRPSLTSLFARNPDSISTSFTRAYLEQHKDERVQALQQAGLVTVAAAVANAELVIWLMEQGADPTIGGEPSTYMATKNKGVRLALRRFWGMNPTLFDYEAAGIPSPLTQDELDAIAEREREKKRKEKAKKKEKKHEMAEAAKPPEQRARELRAAAAEARRQGGSMSANFKK